MMSIFKKAAPEPPAKVEPKGSAYDLDIEADGDDPATAATVVNALYAKYKKNVRAADETHARAARIQLARGLRSRPSQTTTTPFSFFVDGVMTRPPRVPASPNAARALLPRARATTRAPRVATRWKSGMARAATGPGDAAHRPMSPSKSNSIVPFLTFFY